MHSYVAKACSNEDCTDTNQRIRYGSKTLDLQVRPETFRHEIYTSDGDSTARIEFAALVSHEAHIKTAESKSEGDKTGEDAALATLKQSLAFMAKEKEARKYVEAIIRRPIRPVLLLSQIHNHPIFQLSPHPTIPFDAIATTHCTSQLASLFLAFS